MRPAQYYYRFSIQFTWRRGGGGRGEIAGEAYSVSETMLLFMQRTPRLGPSLPLQHSHNTANETDVSQPIGCSYLRFEALRSLAPIKMLSAY